MQPDQERSCTVSSKPLTPVLRASTQTSSNKILERLKLHRGQVLSCFAPLSRSLAADSAVYLFGLLVLYFVTTAARAMRPMDFDELTTFYVATMNSVSGGWRVVVNGHVDLQPPLIFAVSHLSTRIFGANQFALRLPCMVAFSIASWCLFVFLKRRSGTVFAMCGAALLLITQAHRYSYEARPYALVLAGAGLALMSWQSAAESRHRPWSLVGVSVGLGIALMSHCYAVLLAIPFAAGEAVRSLQMRRVDRWVWLSFLASCPALLFYPPLFASHAQGFAGNVPMYVATMRSFWVIYRLLLGSATAWVLLALLIALWFARHRNSVSVDLCPLPLHERVAIVFLTLIPWFLIVLTWELKSDIRYRYALMCIFGLAIVLTRGLYMAAAGDSRIGAVILILFTCAFTEEFVSDVHYPPYYEMPIKAEVGHEHRIDSDTRVPGHPLLSMVDPDIPVLVSTPSWFAQIAHDAPPVLASRLYYLTDVRSAAHYTRSDFWDRAYPNMLRSFRMPGHIVPYSDFMSRQDRFDVYCSDDVFEWLLPKLGSDQTVFKFIARQGPVMLLEACHHCELAKSGGH